MNKSILLTVAGFIFFLLQGCAEKQNLGTIVARVGSDAITTEDLTRALQEIPKPNQYEYLTDAGKRILVEMMIDWKLMAKEAVKIGLDRETAFKQEASSSIDKEQVLGNGYVRYRIKQMQRVTDTEIESYYLSHTNEFALPAKIRVHRIVFDNKEKAREALAAFKEGVTFENYKQTHPQSKIKVDTLWLQHRENGSETESVAFSLNGNELSEILAINAGYCLLRVEERVPARNQLLGEVRESLRARLQNNKERELVENIRKDLRKHLNITINKSVLESYQCKECAEK